HYTVHTWKDFFIHLATISIGLLIAIGLEQSAVYLWSAEDFRAHNPGSDPQAAWNGAVLRRIAGIVLPVLPVTSKPKPWATIERLARLAGCPKVTQKYARSALS
ncbi:MAG: hypothetical protein WB646_12045, partial [Steroidobacteraceae bacterium]